MTLLATVVARSRNSRGLVGCRSGLSAVSGGVPLLLAIVASQFGAHPSVVAVAFGTVRVGSGIGLSESWVGCNCLERGGGIDCHSVSLFVGVGLSTTAKLSFAVPSPGMFSGCGESTV